MHCTRSAARAERFRTASRAEWGKSIFAKILGCRGFFLREVEKIMRREREVFGIVKACVVAYFNGS